MHRFISLKTIAGYSGFASGFSRYAFAARLLLISAAQASRSSGKLCLLPAFSKAGSPQAVKDARTISMPTLSVRISKHRLEGNRITARVIALLIQKPAGNLNPYKQRSPQVGGLTEPAVVEIMRTPRRFEANPFGLVLHVV